VERAAGELRRGAPVLIRAAKRNESVVAVAAETVTDATLAGLSKLCGAPFSILTHARAATLKIRLYTPDVVSIAQPASVTSAELRALADPAIDLDNPLKGPFDASRVSPSDAAKASVQLAKLAGLLPATAVFNVPDRMINALVTDLAIAEVPSAAIRGFDESLATHLQLLTRVRVPLDGAEDAELAAFRPKDGGQEHYAVIIGDKRGAALAPPGPVLTRLHSECFTGDLLGSLKCDCGDQLRGAVTAIAHRRRRHPALSRAGGPRYRPDEQAACVPFAGRGLRHDGGQSPSSVSPKTSGSTTSRRGCCICSATPRSG
jgi:GTP cyclohydrolase II